MQKVRTAARMAAVALQGSTHFDIRVVRPDWQDAVPSPLTERIKRAFLAMKAVAPPAWCRPSAMWQAQLDAAFPLATRFEEFLANFGVWPTYTGIEEAGYWIARLGRFALGRRYVEQTYFRRQLAAWETRGRDLKRLTFPRFGNQAGATYRGQFVSCGAPFTDLHALELAQLVAGLEHPVICEIGGGYGKLAYALLRDLPRFTYYDFDLPETLCTAAYYLGQAFPEKRMRLFGETGDADIVLMPAWEIANLEAADLVFNKNSLGEMDADTCRAYIAHIARICRGHFLHLNHDRVRCDGALLASEYEVPMRLISRSPDIGHLITADGGTPDIFQYLYAR